VSRSNARNAKTRATTTTWDDAKVISPNQVLAVASIGRQVGLVRVDKSTTRGWLRRVTGRKRDALHCNAIERYTVT
jgi:hypothetical protein